MNKLSTLHAPNAAALEEVLHGLRPRRFAVADLSLSSWGPQSLATQWLSQIIGRDVTPRSYAPPIEQLLALGEAMCASIDEEGRGNFALIQAHGAAQQLARVLAYVPTALVVLVPGYGFSWRHEDRLLTEYLLATSPETSITLISTAPLKATSFTPPRNLAHALPTALSPALATLVAGKASAGLVVLDNGWAIVAPEYRLAGGMRFDTEALDRFEHPRLLPFRAFAMLHAQNDALDPWHICFEAWRQCHSGYREVALKLADSAVARTRDANIEAAIRAQRQAMRLANASFADAAKEPPPALGVEPEIATLIEACRGWGMVMTNRPSEALQSLRTALSLCATDRSNKGDLFFMNITALAELREGHTERALTLENAIEARLAMLPGPNSELIFVNSLNLSRLKRYIGHFEDSERYLRQAFSTFEGARTETDHVNADLCFARLATARSDAEAAFDHWIRAAMQWVASRCPEALNWRVQMLVIGDARRIAIRNHIEAAALVEQLAGGFVLALDQAAAAAGRTICDDATPARHFLASEKASDDVVPLRLLGGTNWSVIAATTCRQSRHQGVAMQRLRRRLTGWIEAQWPAKGENAYLIDRRDGSSMPGDIAEQVASAVDHGVGAIHLPDCVRPITKTEIGKLCDSRVLQINPIVAAIDGEQARFRRYLQPYVFTSADAEIVASARIGRTVKETLAKLERLGIPAATARRALLKLRKHRVIQLRIIDPDTLNTFYRDCAIVETNS